MNLFDLRDYAVNLMCREGLEGWTFSYDRATRRAGLCNYTHQKITVSRHLMTLYDRERATDTVIHEVAHALAGPGAAHGPAWRRHVARLGGSASVRVDPDAPRIEPPWQGTCSCGATFGRMRRPAAGLRCRRCFTHGLDGAITWQRRAS